MTHDRRARRLARPLHRRRARRLRRDASPTPRRSTARVLAEVARAGAGEVDLAVRAAHDAFPAWAALGPAGRAPYLHRLADLIDANVERLAAVECADMAMLLRSLRARVINRGARNYRAYADLALAYEERDWRSNGTWNRVQRMPAGPAAVITPWNAPFMLSTWKTAPALAAGCTVVLKPAEWSPLACSLLADLAARGRAAARRLQRRPGHRRGGRRRARRAPAAAPRLVHRLARDGAPDRRRRGREPRAVHRRARRQEPVPRVRRRRPRRRRAQGRRPVRRRRPGLPRRHAAARRGVGRATPSSTRFHAAADEHVLGDPRDDATTISPLIHPDHLARVEGFVERARAAGDEIVRGGRRARRPVLRADADRADVQRRGDRPARGLRARADAADVRQRGGGRRARQLDRLRAVGDRLHGLDRARGPRSDGRSAAARCGSTPSSCATSPRRSAAWGSRGSAARAATTRSTSTPTSRRCRSWRARSVEGGAPTGARTGGRGEEEQCRPSIHRRSRLGPPGGESGKLHRRALGVPDLVFFIVAASAPLTAVAGGQAATYLVTGNKGVPFMFIPLGIMLGAVRRRLRGDEPPRDERGRVLRLRRARARQGPGASAPRSSP